MWLAAGLLAHHALSFCPIHLFILRVIGEIGITHFFEKHTMLAQADDHARTFSFGIDDVLNTVHGLNLSQ